MTTRYSKTRPTTEIERIKSLFPDYDNTQLEAITDAKGNILSLETDDPTLQQIMKDEGFTEEVVRITSR